MSDRRDPRKVAAAIARAASPVDKAAIKLREAAIAFANAPFDEADLHDRIGSRRNKALLGAAVAYTDAMRAKTSEV